ncbi:MAG TPA: STAS domain-containing protein [Anaeromyxobacter sp.]|nr:STAS domain-containing protein [Anaeromyxobacter sp.]
MSNGAGEVVIRLEGVFDAAAAQRLSSAIEHADGDEIRVDLTDVREFHDFGIAMLAHALSGRSGVAISGLRQHQLRLLRYFGIDAGPADLGTAVELQ